MRRCAARALAARRCSAQRVGAAAGRSHWARSRCSRPSRWAGAGVNAAIARLNDRAADARVGQRRADLLPRSAAGATLTARRSTWTSSGSPSPPASPIPSTSSACSSGRRRPCSTPALIARLRARVTRRWPPGSMPRPSGEIAGATAGLAYLRVLSAEETVRARQADSTIAADLLDQARQLVEAGVSPAIDATRSEVSFAAVRTQLEVARNARRPGPARPAPGARPAVRQPARAGGLARPGAAGSAARDPATAAAFAREHRAELAAERARTERARRNLSAIRAENLPSLSVEADNARAGQRDRGISRAPTTCSCTSASRSSTASAGRAGSKEQNVRVDIQQIRERDLVNQVETEARQAVLDLASAGSRWRSPRSGCGWRSGAGPGAGAISGRRRRKRGDDQRAELGHRGARRPDPGAGGLRHRPGQRLSRARRHRPTPLIEEAPPESS